MGTYSENKNYCFGQFSKVEGFIKGRLAAQQPTQIQQREVAASNGMTNRDQQKRSYELFKYQGPPTPNQPQQVYPTRNPNIIHNDPSSLVVNHNQNHLNFGVNNALNNNPNVPNPPQPQQPMNLVNSKTFTLTQRNQGKNGLGTTVQPVTNYNATTGGLKRVNSGSNANQIQQITANGQNTGTNLIIKRNDQIKQALSLDHRKPLSLNQTPNQISNVDNLETNFNNNLTVKNVRVPLQNGVTHFEGEVDAMQSPQSIQTMNKGNQLDRNHSFIFLYIQFFLNSNFSKIYSRNFG